jgi:hypothetical protein
MTHETQTTDKQNVDLYYSKLFTNISFTHFAELIKIKDTTKRKFYELLIVKNTLSVRELERQITSPNPQVSHTFPTLKLINK